jgi:hypothetical protein
MITSYDTEYQATKLVKQGDAILEPVLAELAAWIANKWGVSVVNVIYDLYGEPGTMGKSKLPRLQVCVEHTRERRVFFDGLNFDSDKQEKVGEHFKELVRRHQSGSRYRVERLLTVFSAFAPLARQEADSQVTEQDIGILMERIQNPNLWTIHRSFGHVTFFFYTGEQARAGTKASLDKAYADLYFGILKNYDKFCYMSRERFSVAFDSKENFDITYGSSWLAYDR